jgi:flagellar assembly protein FliH
MSSNAQSAAPAATPARAWSAPAISISGGLGRTLRQPEQMQAGERNAWQEAVTAGHAAGLAQAQKEIDTRVRALEERTRAMQAALHALGRPLAQVDDQVHEQIARLAMALARALVRRELRTDPSQIIGIVRETVALLPASARGVRVMLHPEDAALVREKLATPGQDQAWSIVEDPMLARGDCRVHTEYAQIDARIETRVNEALTLLLGDERVQSRGGEEA